MGVASSWVGRLGADSYGRLVHEELQRRGVDLQGVQLDTSRPTGYYTKQPVVDETGEPRSRVEYWRAGSAASGMSPALLDDPNVAAVLSRSRVIHTSGINAALSASSAELMRALLGRPRRYAAMVSFDVNWREQLWPTGDTGVVADLAAMADLVLVGADEAERVFGTSDPLAVRAMLPGPARIIVKDGARRALAMDKDGTVHEEPALRVQVVEPVGAGDAFAAGYLAGVVRGEDARRCLRRGHLSAATVLTVTGDSAPAPLEQTQRLLDVSAEEWQSAVVSAAGVTLGPPVGEAGQSAEARP
jgi:2-dehydro-3-deoxygluconokinase